MVRWRPLTINVAEELKFDMNEQESTNASQCVKDGIPPFQLLSSYQQAVQIQDDDPGTNCNQQG